MCLVLWYLSHARDWTTESDAVLTVISNHLSQIILLFEVLVQGIELVDDILGAGNNSLLWSNLAIGLYAKYELCFEGMRNLEQLACCLVET
jgi:hypothetical protein